MSIAEIPSSSERVDMLEHLLPEIQLSDGSAQSKTAPQTLDAAASPSERVAARFLVKGNALVTGGGGALALEGARALLEHGVSGLALLDKAFSSVAHELIASLHREFPGAVIRVVEVSVTDGPALTAAIDAAAAEFGSIDILTHFAGVISADHAIDVDAATFRRHLDINTTGAFLSAQAAARQMRRQKSGGSIVLVASLSAHRANFPFAHAAYNASKTALLGMVRSLAAEWAVHGIRINTLSPGYMDTVMNQGPGMEVGRREWVKRIPMGRIGHPEELTGPLVLLCSRFGGAYLTGTDILVDGGASVF